MSCVTLPHLYAALAAMKVQGGLAAGGSVIDGVKNPNIFLAKRVYMYV